MTNKSFFMRNFVSYASLVLIALVLAGTVFIHQVSQYSQDEKQAQLAKTASTVADQTSLVLDNYSELRDRLYQFSLLSIAQDDNVVILVTSIQGNVQLITDAESVRAGGGHALASDIVTQARRRVGYAGQGQLSGLLPEPSYIVGVPCVSAQGETLALVFVCSSSRGTTGMLTHVTRVFIVIVAVALAAMLGMTYFISSRMTRPLATMANAARAFAQGDFSVRVPEDNRCDEIDELACSFNAMAGGLDQLEELTRGFIGNVSHEFKTPMTTIGGFVDGMRDGTIPPEQHQKYLTIISEEVNRLSRMVVRMLDAAKIQSGELLLAPAPFDFSEMASQIILSFERKLTDKHIEPDVQMDDQLIVMGDRDHVFRAVYNLIDNAAKFIDDGGKLCLRASAENGMCAFSVTNTGGGIPPEDIPHIFDRFYKADPSRSRDRTGAGLGLYIVKNIINLHGGDISVRSDGGETEFSFTLPLAHRKKQHGKNVEKAHAVESIPSGEEDSPPPQGRPL